MSSLGLLEYIDDFRGNGYNLKFKQTKKAKVFTRTVNSHHIHSVYERIYLSNKLDEDPLQLSLSWIDLCVISLDVHFAHTAMKNSNQGKVVSFPGGQAPW